MAVAPLLTLALALAAAPGGRAATPTAGLVSDAEVVRLLSADYGERVRLRGTWPVQGAATARRAVCADSGPRRGERRVAVCTTLPAVDPETPGIVDLFVLQPAARRGRASVRARFSGIESGARGAPGPVGFLALGPASTAFVVASPTLSGVWRRDSETLFAERGGHLRDVLRVHTRLSNAGRCTPGRDAAGRRCIRQTVDLRCTLRVDTTRLDDGLYALELHVSGTRGGQAIDRIVPILHDAFGYLVSTRVLARQGCDAES